MVPFLLKHKIILYVTCFFASESCSVINMQYKKHSGILKYTHHKFKFSSPTSKTQNQVSNFSHH